MKTIIYSSIGGFLIGILTQCFGVGWICKNGFNLKGAIVNIILCILWAIIITGIFGE